MTTEPVTYHPDPTTNAEVAADALAAEISDLAIGYPPRRWTSAARSTRASEIPSRSSRSPIPPLERRATRGTRMGRQVSRR